MTGPQLEQLIRARNFDVIDAAGKAGPPVVSSLEKFLRDPDEVIRLLAVNSIAAAGGPKAPQLLIQSLGDVNEQVRDNAVNALHQRVPTGQQPALLAAWDASKTRDGYVRQQIPMVVGRTRESSAIAPLRDRLGRDQRQSVKDGVIAGMAKLGDVPSRATLGEMLRDAKGPRTADLMQFVTYEDEPWVIPLLIPALQRRDIARVISTHVMEIKRRDCDLAVDEVIRISKARFSFPVDTLAQYTEAQIAEVLKYAQAQPR
jgi:HEAT repeat protein